MDKPIKVGIIGIKGFPAQAGVDRVVEGVVRRLPALGITPTVFCDHSFTAEDYSLEGVNIVRVRSASGKYLGAPTRFLNSALHALISEKFDLIHLHNIEAGFIIPLLRLKYPVVSTAHGFAYWRSKWGPLARRLIMLADWPFVTFSSVVTSVSEKDAQGLRSKYHKNIIYIPNGVGTEFLPDMNKASRLLANLGLSPHNYLIFVAGRIEPTKGAHLAIEAINRLEREIHLLVVGDLNQMPAYRQKLIQLAGRRIHFVPLIKDKELLFGLIASSRCLIFPSIVEAMSMVLLEAASLGVPILASNIQENQAILREDIEYFESEDLDSLLDRLSWVLDNEAYMYRKGKDAQQRAHREYNWDLIAAKYAALYENLDKKRSDAI
jgi:glycosyltransferase involved in cell wall biosynthesis